MGSKVDKVFKAAATGGISLIDDSGAVRTGKSQAQRAQKKQEAAIATQQKKETQRLAQSESDVATRRALGKKGRGGRQSLIATTTTGLATNLGGSA
jgi:hypothetical protein